MAHGIAILALIYTALLAPPIGLAVLWAGADKLIATLCNQRWERERRRQEAGACVRCGYDLRATPGRCPECGKPADRSGRLSG